MKKENNYWVGENNNKWSCDNYTKKQAIELSKTLINCYNCTNCCSCSNCSSCRDCSSCIDCRDCRDCRSCCSCSNCSSCRFCSSCRDCSSFSDNPQIYRTEKIGSRDSQTIFYWTDKENISVVCGCFIGNLQEFISKVKNSYNKNNEYYKQYMDEVKKVKILVGIS